jgi:hypothetical protein
MNSGIITTETETPHTQKKKKTTRCGKNKKEPKFNCHKKVILLIPTIIPP